MITFGSKKGKFFGTLGDLKKLIQKINKQNGIHYNLVKQKGTSWLIEQDLGDDYLDYAMIEVVGNKVRAVSPDVVEFLKNMKERAAY